MCLFAIKHFVDANINNRAKKSHYMSKHLNLKFENYQITKKHKLYWI